MTEIAGFLVLLFGVTWPWGYFVIPTAVSQGQAAFLVAFLPMVWMPTLIALVMVRSTQGAGAVTRELRARLSRRKATPLLFLVAMTPLLTGGIAMVAARGAGDSAPFLSPSALAISIGLQIISGSTGEELGWRGFLLPRLRARLGVTGAAVSMGLLWALWHVPTFYTPGMPHRFIPMAPMLLVIGTFGVCLAMLFFRAGDSVLPTMAAHVALNVILGIGGFNGASRVFWITLAAQTVLLAVAAMRWCAPKQDVLTDRTVVACARRPTSTA